MPVPRKRTSRARKNNRRSHIHLTLPKVQNCPHCGNVKVPHRVCIHCGTYKEKEIIQLKEAK